MCADIPKFGLAIVKDGFVLDNVVAITLATRSVLCRMLTAGVAALLRSGSVESVCNTKNFGRKIFWQIAEIMTFGRIYFGG